MTLYTNQYCIPNLDWCKVYRVRENRRIIDISIYVYIYMYIGI